MLQRLWSRRHPSPHRRGRYFRPRLEVLESRMAPAGLSGEVWSDLNGNGLRDTGEPGLAGVMLYLDLNFNQTREASEPTVTSGPNGAYEFQNLQPGTYSVAQVPVTGLVQTFPPATPPVILSSLSFEGGAEGFTSSGTKNQWHLSTGRGSNAGHSASTSFYFGASEGASGGGQYANNASGTLLSPPIDLRGVSGPVRLEFSHFLNAEAGFDFATVGVLADGVETPLASNRSSIGGLPNSTSGFQTASLDLSAFAGRQVQVFFRFTSDSSITREGWYVDDVALRIPGRSGYLVPLLADQTVTNLDFGNGVRPDLVGGTFDVVQGTAAWGDTLTVNYALRNDGPVAADQFRVDLLLSSDATVDSGDVLLTSFVVAGLAARASTSGTLDVPLPGTRLTPPVGFTIPDDVFLGFRIDADGAVPEVDEGNNANRGANVDRDSLRVVSPPGRIRGTKWEDLDGDGVRDPGEPGRAGVTVFLDLNGNGARNGNEPSQVTDAEGRYEFADLEAGRYGVGEVVPAGFAQTFPGAWDGLPLQADFGGAGGPDAQGFTSEGSLDQWHLSTGRGSNAGHSAATSFYFGDDEDPDGDGAYASNASGTLLSPLIDLRGVSGPVRLEFSHFLDTEAGFDFATVGVLADGVETPLASNRSSIHGLRSRTSGFETVSLDLSAFAGRQVRVFFSFTSDDFFEEEGWYVDDVVVTTSSVKGLHTVDLPPGGLVEGVDFGNVRATDLVSTSVTVLQDEALWGDTVTVRYEIANQGPIDAGPFVGRLFVSGDNQVTTADTPMATLTFPGLAAGAVLSGTVAVRLPGAPGSPPPTLTEPDDVFVGLVVDAENAVPETAERNNVSVAPSGLVIGRLEAEPNDAFAQATRIEVNRKSGGVIATPSDVDLFAIPVPTSGRLTARVSAAGFDTRLSLLSPDGRVLVQSQGQASGGLNDVIVQPLQSTPDRPFYLRVEGLEGGVGAYVLSAEFRPATLPFQPLPVGDTPTALTQGDFNGDGFLDLAGTNFAGGTVSVLLGLGDGTFGLERRFTVGTRPRSIVAVDLDGDRDLELVVGNAGDTSGVSVLFGRGDGTFESQQRLSTVSSVYSLLVDDFDGDGKVDLAVAEGPQRRGSLLLGQGNGAFAAASRFTLQNQAVALAAGDFDGDRLLDLAVVDYDAGRVSVFTNAGGGTFRSEVRYSVGTTPFAVVAGDFTGDQVVDLVAARAFGRGLALLVGNGDGTFRDAVQIPGGNFFQSIGNLFSQPALASTPATLLAGDFNHDGRLDLAAANAIANDFSVLLGLGDGTFEPEARFGVGEDPSALVAGDFNGDGLIDVAAANATSDNLSVLMGRQDSLFQAAKGALGAGVTLAVADFDSDGRLDVAAAPLRSRQGAVFLGLGDGTFRFAPPFEAPAISAQFAAGDVNQDGRLDLVSGGGVLLGRGDGGFQQGSDFPLIPSGGELTAGDFNRDGNLDYAFLGLMTRGNSSAVRRVAVVLGLGGGAFTGLTWLDPGEDPQGLVAGDFNGDDVLDLATASNDNDEVTILLGLGDGSFAAGTQFPAGPGSASLLADDFDRDGALDLAVGDLSGAVFVLRGRGDGTFRTPDSFPAAGSLFSLASGDLNRDGNVDLVAADFGSINVRVLLGRGDGTFEDVVSYPVGLNPIQVILVDFNDDGNLDLLTGNSGTQDFSVLLGLGDGRFVAPDTVSTAIRSTPVVADWDGDDVADVAVLNRQGEILLRRGRAGSPGVFEVPIVLNAGPELAARDLVSVVTAGEVPSLVAVGVRSTAGQSAVEISLYSLQRDGTVRRTLGPVVPGSLAGRLAAADLNRDGLDDLVVTVVDSGEVLVYLQTAAGFALAPAQRLPVGRSPSDVLVTDLDGDRLPDVVVTGLGTGDVTVFLSEGEGTVSDVLRFRSGTGLYGLDPATATILSQQRPGNVVAGLIDEDALPDLVVVNRGSGSFSLLKGSSGGGFLDPSVLAASGASPLVAVTADFNRDSLSDLVYLDDQTGALSVLLNEADGGFSERSGQGRDGRAVSLVGGNAPTGLSVADLDQDGNLDLLVGNGFGDVLFLPGNGDGTFRSFVRADQRVPFAVTDLDGDGDLDVVLAEQAHDRAAALTRQPVAAGVPNAFTPAAFAFTPAAFERDASGGLIGPGDVAVADVDGQNGDDLIFANTGSNNVLVYLRQADGSFTDEALSFFAGTSPVALHPTQLNDDNGDGVIDDQDFLDLAVANQGSNDVSILLGSRGRDNNDDGAFSDADLFQIGPRLKTTDGMTPGGPNAVTTRDVTGDGIPDVLATNGLDGTLATIPGIGTLGLGTGSFDSTDLRLAPLSPAGAAPQPVVQTQVLGPTLGFALTQGGSLIRFDPTTGSAAAAFTDADTPALAFFVVATPQAFAAGNPVIFTANAGGSVSVLVSADGDAFTEFLTGEGGFETPSALEVLERADGVFEFYLTEAGESQPVLLTLEVRLQLQTPPEGGNPFVPVAVGVTDLTNTGAPDTFDGPSFPFDGSNVPLGGPSALATTLPLGVFNPVLVGLGAFIDLDEVSFEGDVVVGLGEQLIAFITDGEGDFAVGGEGAGHEDGAPADLPPDEQGELRSFILPLKRELKLLTEPAEGEGGGENGKADEVAPDGKAMPDGDPRPRPEQDRPLPPEEIAEVMAPAPSDARAARPPEVARPVAEPVLSEAALMAFVLLAAGRPAVKSRPGRRQLPLPSTLPPA